MRSCSVVFWLIIPSKIATFSTAVHIRYWRQRCANASHLPVIPTIAPYIIKWEDGASDGIKLWPRVMKRLAAAEEIMALVMNGMGFAPAEHTRRSETWEGWRWPQLSWYSRHRRRRHYYWNVTTSLYFWLAKSKKHQGQKNTPNLNVDTDNCDGTDGGGGVKVRRNVKWVVKRDKRPRGERRGKSKKRHLFFWSSKVPQKKLLTSSICAEISEFWR